MKVSVVDIERCGSSAARQVCQSRQHAPVLYRHDLASSTGSGSLTRWIKAAARWLVLGLFTCLAQCKPAPKSHSLGVTGYNYTDRYIDSFSVGPVSGGNIYVSDMESTGNGQACCLEWTEGTELPIEYTVHWTRDGDVWCRVDVVVTGPIPQDPTIFAVHFYQDGRVQAEIASVEPEARVKMGRFDENHRKEAGNQVFDNRFGSCQTREAWLRGDPK